MKLAIASIAALALMTSGTFAHGLPIHSDQVSLPIPPKAATFGSVTTGSIGTHGGAQGHMQPQCDPRPTAYDPYFGFCEAAVYNVTSLSERSTGSVKVKLTDAVPGVPAQCVVTYATGPWWNPSFHTHTQNC